MSQIDEAERQRLAEAVWQMEQVLHRHSASAGGAVTSMLVNFVEGAKNRIAALDAEMNYEAEQKKEREERLQSAAISLAEREMALNQQEREQYAQFLSRAFFTKQDFGALEEFYTSAWDRLSEDGKAQMSHRIWEGVRRDEYEFSELPEVVRRKEAQRLHDMLVRHENLDSNLEAIPAKDRTDFLSAWESGNRKEAYNVLDRSSFSENVGLTAEKSVHSTAAVGTSASEAAQIRNAQQSRESQDGAKDPAGAAGMLDLQGLDIQIGQDADSSAKLPTQVASADSDGPAAKTR